MSRVYGGYAWLVREPGLVSVVAPLHDEQDTIGAFHARTVAALDPYLMQFGLERRQEITTNQTNSADNA